MAKHLTKPLSRKLLVKIVVNKKEYDAIAKAARKRGLSMSAYAREKALGLADFLTTGEIVALADRR
jgi:hypothetical protein